MMKNERYNWYKENHPDWSDEQIWTAVSIDMKSKDVVQRGGDVDIDDPDVIQRILIGAREWLATVLPDIFEKVKKAFIIAIDKLSEWTQKGLNAIVDFIARILTGEVIE